MLSPLLLLFAVILRKTIILDVIQFVFFFSTWPHLTRWTSCQCSCRQSTHCRRHGCQHTEGDWDVNGPVATVLWDTSVRKRETLQCHQPGVQPHTAREPRQTACFGKSSHNLGTLKGMLFRCFYDFRVTFSLQSENLFSFFSLNSKGGSHWLGGQYVAPASQGETEGLY